MTDSTNTFKDLLIHFQAESEALAKVLAQSAIHDNKPDLGSIREDAVINFLKRYVPSGFDVTKGGFIFDSEGNKSDQMDILITTDSTLKFQHSIESIPKTFNCIEGCLAVISVKTKLTTDELQNAITNLQSIPTTKVYSGTPQMNDVIKNLPLKIIFGFGGITLDTCKANFASVLNEIPIEQRPDLIINNDEWIVQKPDFETVDGKGQKMSENKFSSFSKEHSQFVGGRSLITLLTSIQRYGMMAKDLKLHFGIYMNKIKMSDDTWTGDPIDKDRLSGIQ